MWVNQIERPHYLWRQPWIWLVMVIFGIGCQQRGEDTPNVPIIQRNLESVLFSSFLGGPDARGEVRDIAIDGEGHIYVTGGTQSSAFPTTPGAFDQTGNGDWDVFVVKFDPEGKLEWSTVIGGPSYDRAYAIEIDDEGNIYLSGRAGRGFPTTQGAFQVQFKGGPSNAVYPSQSGFVAKLSSDGAKLLWSSYFGAGDDPAHPVRDLAVGETGDVFIAASSSTGNFPDNILLAFAQGEQPIRRGKRDAVVARIKADGSTLLWATYLGGSESEDPEGSIRVSTRGNVYYLTTTVSTDAVVTEDSFDTSYNGNGDFYLVKLNAEGRVLFATYLGGTDSEQVETHELAVDQEEAAIIASGTRSPDFPITKGAFQQTYGGTGGAKTGLGTNYQGDIVVAKLSGDGTTLLTSTYIGGRGGESAEGVDLDDQGNVYITGGTFSDDFPTSKNAVQPKAGGKADAFAVILSHNFQELLFSTFIGTNESETFRAAASGKQGRFYMGGISHSPDWPLHHALDQARHERGNSVIVGLAPHLDYPSRK